MTLPTTESLVAREIANGAAQYQRERDLPKLIPRLAWTGKSDTEICSMLTSYIRGAAKGLARGHWAADSNRLMALLVALFAEQRAATGRPVARNLRIALVREGE